MANAESMSEDELNHWKQGMFKLVDNEISQGPSVLGRYEIPGVRWLAEEFKKLELRAIKKYPNDERHISTVANAFYSSNLFHSGGVKRNKRGVGRIPSYSITLAEMILWVFARCRNDSRMLNHIHRFLQRGGELPTYWLNNSGQPLSAYNIPIFPKSRETDPNGAQKLKEQLWQTIYISKGFKPNRIAKSSKEKSLKRMYFDINASTPIPPPGKLPRRAHKVQMQRLKQIEDLFKPNPKLPLD